MEKGLPHDGHLATGLPVLVRHEARVSRMGVKDRHRLIVVAVG